MTFPQVVRLYNRGPVSELVEQWVPRVYRFALRLCNDPDVADDLTQETFLRAWRHRGRLRDPRVLRVWLFRIATNLWRDRLRRGRFPIAQPEILSDSEQANEPAAERLVSVKEELSLALGAMNALPNRQREVLYLIACEEMSAAEVSQVLDISTDAVKSSLSLARKQMRRMLLDEFDRTPSSLDA